MDPNDECAISATNMINDLQAEVERLTTERDHLLASLHDGHESLRDGVLVLQDLPPDTVLGESGTQAIDELAHARNNIGGMLANYPDAKATSERVRTHGEALGHWRRKILDERREHKAALARLRTAVENALPYLAQHHLSSGTTADHELRVALVNTKETSDG